MIDDPIETYCNEILATAELARSDLQEIEDHLRELADELEMNGLSSADAIAEACRRLGPPAVLAREYMRVRPAFGMRLPRARAWSAALLLAWVWFDFARLTLGGPGLVSIFGVNLVISGVALGGLVARSSWARAIILGALSWWIVDQTYAFICHTEPQGHLFAVASKLGAFAFLVPWRRRELALAGLVIVLLAWSYHSVNMLAAYQLTAPSQMPFATFGLGLAFVGTLAAGLGVLVRSRWAALAACVALAGLVMGFADVWPLLIQKDPHIQFQVLGALAAGQITAAAAALLAFTGSRAPRLRAPSPSH